MTTTLAPSTERVVELTETGDGVATRTFYCIHDAEFQHWMADEPFDGKLWTRDIKQRLEFATRREAEEELSALQDWREEREPEAASQAQEEHQAA